jgi:hypothetical protein
MLTRIAGELSEVEQIMQAMRAKQQRRARPTSLDGYEAPRTPAETTLADLTAQILNLDPIA